MNVKIYFKVSINTTPPIITFKNQIVDYNKEQFIEQRLNYPNENEISFDVTNVENNSSNIEITKITLNELEVNKFYNTSFKMCNNRWVKEKTLTSISNICFNGHYKLCIDERYVRSHRAMNWHCSPHKDDFVYNYEFVQDSFDDGYRDRNHRGFEGVFIPCFGCSFTYGEAQPPDATWPFLSSQKFRKNFLNLGVCGLGIDGIYNNIKLLYKKHKFKECFILFPNFERRLVRCKINHAWFKIPSTVNLDTTKSFFSFYNHPQLRKKMEIVRQKIIKDTKNQYSKKILEKIKNFCKNNSIELYCSSWSDEVYEYLSISKDINLLTKFPKINTFTERAEDGVHPHKKHYQLFVDQTDL